MSSDFSNNLSSVYYTQQKYLIKKVLLYQCGSDVHYLCSTARSCVDRNNLSELFSKLVAVESSSLTKAYIDARVVGSGCQSDLLIGTALALQQSKLGTVRFVSPRILRATKHTPAEVAFEAMLREDLPQLTLTGGWRPVGVTELRSFQFLNNPVNWSQHPAACVVDSLLPLPLQRKLKVVGDLPHPLKHALGQLLSLIEDPRWFLTDDVIASDHLLDLTTELDSYFSVKESHAKVTKALADGRLFEPSTESEQRLLVLLQVCLGLTTCPLRVRSLQLSDTKSLLTLLIKEYFHAIYSNAANWDVDKCLRSVSGPAAVAFSLRTILALLSAYWLHETAPTGWEFFVPSHFFEEIARSTTSKISANTKINQIRFLTHEAAMRLALTVSYARSAWPFKLGYKPL
jgi:hypothetical protein